MPEGVIWHFDPDCKACQEHRRTVAKAIDPARALVERRAQSAAIEAGVTKEFFLDRLGYRALIPFVRLVHPLTRPPEPGTCLDCEPAHHLFRDENDLTFEHREPPRHAQDWARRHARNICVVDRSCNSKKRDKPYAQYLEDCESARQTAVTRELPPQPTPVNPQGNFDF
jgi:hypothetical protein